MQQAPLLCKLAHQPHELMQPSRNDTKLCRPLCYAFKRWQSAICDAPMRIMLIPLCRLPHVPLAPMAERGGPEENILMRTLAELAPSWRQGVDHAKPLPQCVQEPNVTYEDFLQNDTFYFA